MNLFNKVCIAVYSTTASIVATNPVLAAGLENLKVGGSDAELVDGDLMQLIKNIILALIGLIAAGYCIYSLIQTVVHLIHGWNQFRSNKEDSLVEAIGKPLVTGVIVTGLTFAVAVYLNLNTAKWLGL